MRLYAYMLAAIVVMGVSAARADEDFSDQKWICNATIIERELLNLLDSGLAGKIGVHLLYVKDVEETSRTKDELRCRITAVMNNGQQMGFFQFLNQDGHTLVGFQPE